MPPTQQLFYLWFHWFPLAESYEPGTFETIQLEDGSTAYVHRPVLVPPGSTVLEVQAETGLEELAGEEEDNAFDVETALKQYAGKVRTRHGFHGAPAARGAGVASVSGLGSNCLPFLSLYIWFSAMPALRRETGRCPH